MPDGYIIILRSRILAYSCTVCLLHRGIPLSRDFFFGAVPVPVHCQVREKFKFEGRQTLIDLRPTICVAPARSNYYSRQGSAAAASTTTAVLALLPPTRASQAHCRPATIYNRRLTKTRFWVRRFGGGGTHGSHHSPGAAVQPRQWSTKKSQNPTRFIGSNKISHRFMNYVDANYYF